MSAPSRPRRPSDAAYSPGAVARLTGLSAHRLRAWERRHNAISPTRTDGGTRRYSDQDVHRLRLLRRAVHAGHPIRELADLSDEEVERRAGGPATVTASSPSLPLDDLFARIRGMDGEGLDRLLALQFSLLGAQAFATKLAAPLLRAIGDEWQAGRISVAEEHLATATLRNVLGAALRRDTGIASGPRIVFSTLAGERHEIGTLLATSYALGLGARVTYLGADLPHEELVRSVGRLNAHAVALGVSHLPAERAREQVEALRASLPNEVEIWLGGHGAAALDDLHHVETLSRLEELEAHVTRIS